MTLGDILEHAANKDLAHQGKQKISYSEKIENDKLEIILSSEIFPEAFIKCEVPLFFINGI